jgi:hypothetical protein
VEHGHQTGGEVGGAARVSEDICEKGDPFNDPAWHKDANKPKQKAERFIGCPVPWLVWVAPLMKSKEQLILALYLYRRCVVCRSNTVTVPTLELEELGIGRWAKRRLLVVLEQAGVLTIRKRNGRATQVRLNHWPDPPS